MCGSRFTSKIVVCILVVASVPLFSQKSPNSNPVYQQVRTAAPGDNVINVTNVELKRDAATFKFTSGSFAFYNTVNGKITGAVFHGSGHFHLAPPTPDERRNLALLTHAEEFDEDFERAVFRFTDDTAAELKKVSTGVGSPDGAFSHSAGEFRSFQRQKLYRNIDLRITEDLLSPAAGGSYFVAGIHGKKNGHMVFTIDPHGAPDVSPEEVSLITWSDWGTTYLAAFASSDRIGAKTDNATYHIPQQDLDVTIEKNGFLTGLAKVQVKAAEDGLVVIPLELYSTLRVSRVTNDKGEALEFVQEKKDEDSDFGVILPAPLKSGETTTLSIEYGGKDVVENEGGANYYPVGGARESWFPNTSHRLGDYTTYTMKFHVPKGLELVATGSKLGETSDSKYTTTTWKTDMPLAVTGFTLGSFKSKEVNIADKGGNKLVLAAYANSEAPDNLRNMADTGIGSFAPVSKIPMQLAEGQNAINLYTQLYGPIPFGKLALTQQYACNYGQSWPMLVYLPLCGYLDTTQQHELGVHPEDMYWKVVTAHEIAHQWWGQTVGFRSYRDQWMSEGFADMSASLYLLYTHKKPDDYRDFWKEQRRTITEKNQFGFRPIDVGPVTMGFRLSTQKAGWSIYRNLVYPKGAYILHMIRMMMWSPKDGDAQFMAMMQDFLKTYRLQTATTEDFKAMVEKHMTPQMDLDRNHTMDWFFRQYVYGTALPNYHFEGQVTPSDKGINMHLTLTQSGVPDEFVVRVPIYMELTDGRVSKMGDLVMRGNKTVDQSFALSAPPSPIKKIWINYYYDVLSTEN